MVNATFAELPPHFDQEGYDEIDRIGWSNIIPDYDSYDAKFKRVLPYLLATLIYQKVKGNLSNLLPADHPIFIQPVFARGYDTRLYPHIYLGIYECSRTGMRATGVSPYIMAMIEIHKVKEYLLKRAAVDEANHEAVMGLLNGMPGQVGDEVEGRCTLNGQAVSRQVINDLLTGMKWYSSEDESNKIN